MNPLTTLEASQKYDLTTGYLRRLLRNKVIHGREARISKTAKVWLIDESSLKAYIKTKPTPGRPKKHSA